MTLMQAEQVAFVMAALRWEQYIDRQESLCILER